MLYPIELLRHGNWQQALLSGTACMLTSVRPFVMCWSAI